jgi:hypothetical protein
MESPADLTQQVIERLMRLKEFTVKVRVEDNWLPNGIVPFNIKIKNNIATVKIPALNRKEAREKVAEYFGSDDFV